MKTQYGLRAVAYLAKSAKKNTPTTLKEISKNEGIPFDFLEKILSELEKQNIVKAKKGVSGGYFLAKKPKDISVFQILKTLEKTVSPVECSGCSRSRKCMTKSVWQKVENSLNKTLESMTLSNLIKERPE